MLYQRLSKTIIAYYFLANIITASIKRSSTIVENVEIASVYVRDCVIVIAAIKLTFSISD